MAGRPRLYARPHHFTLTVEEDAYQMLAGEMLTDYQKRFPRARVTDVARSILEPAIARYAATRSKRAAEAERERTVRQDQLRRLGAQISVAKDDKLEATARRLAALVGSEPMAKTA